MRHIFTLLMIVLALSSCDSSTPKVEPRTRPLYVGVDYRVQELVMRYENMANHRDIKFTKPITVGFADINRGKAVGTCFSGNNFREIEIDNREWKYASKQTREDLLFHELTHCLCGRGHDYGDGSDYPSVGMDEVFDFLRKWHFYIPKPGRYADGCPLSIMYTHVLPDSCLQTHQTEYFTEMFNRCKPW